MRPLTANYFYNTPIFGYDVGYAEGNMIVLNAFMFPNVAGAVAYANNGDRFTFVDVLNYEFKDTGYTFDETSAFAMALLHEYAHVAGADHPGNDHSHYNRQLIEGCLK